jgi:hypothetical protein
MATTTPPVAVGPAGRVDAGRWGSDQLVGGAVVAAGAVAMVGGAVVWSSTGTDLWAALSDRTIESYLIDVEDHRQALFANLAIWIVGAIALGAGGSLLAGHAQNPAARLARFVYPFGATLGVVSFTLWMGLVRVGTNLDTATAETMGFGVTRLDDLATIAPIGIGPALLAASAPAWMGPRLRRSAWLVAAGTALAVVALLTDASMTYGFVLVPIGLIWTIVAAVTALVRATVPANGRRNLIDAVDGGEG